MADTVTEEKKGILLETGTNEFEIVEFSIGKVNYGINVAKVREVITRAPVTAMPEAHPYVDGLFTLRGKAIPLVNMARCLNLQTADELQNIIVTEINNYDIGFLVGSVYRIHRISWKNMEPAPNVGEGSRVVGIIKMEDRIVLLLDFETIIAEINPEINQKLTTVTEANQDAKSRRGTAHVVVAEDSKLLRDLLVTTLHEAGYKFIRDFGMVRTPGITCRIFPARTVPLRTMCALSSLILRCQRWTVTVSSNSYAKTTASGRYRSCSSPRSSAKR